MCFSSAVDDSLIPDLFEIGFSKEMVCGVLFGENYQMLKVTSTKFDKIDGRAETRFLRAP